MDEKAILLMEETGCDQGEAELALDLAQHDLELAIKTIGSLLRHIIALKSKFYFPDKNLYGLLLIVVNTKTCEILRMRTVVSYNPTLYENSTKMDWFALEKLIFSYRLDEGSLPDFTQEVEQKLDAYFNENKAVLVRGDAGEVSSIITNFFVPDSVTVSIEVEELNLTQFSKLPDEPTIPSAKTSVPRKESGNIWLKISFEGDENGKEAERLSEGDVVLSRIVDKRDIAHYLTHLIGTLEEGEASLLPAIIKEVSVNNEQSEVQVYYAPGIVGLARIDSKARVKVLEEKTTPWWKKIFPW